MAEVAGLVLGALPILMKAVEHYRSGLDPFISYFRYNTTLKALHRDLRIQHLYYQDTLKMLLLTELSEDQSDRLFPDAKEPLEPALWGTPEIESILAAKLKTRYEPFKETLEEMDATMKKLMDKLEIDLEGKPAWDSNFSLRDGGNQVRIAWEWRKVRRSFRKSEQQELLQKLEASNRTIERLVNNSNQEVVARSKVRPDSSLAYLESVHEEAGQVFDILEQGWKCSCAVPHDVHLELEQREAVQQFPLFKTLLYVQPLSTHAQPQNNIRHEAHIRLEKMKALVHCATELPPKKLRRAVKFSALPDDCVATGPVQNKETTTRSIDSLEQIRCLCERLNQVCDAHKCLGILPHPSLKKGVTITTTTASAGHSQRPIELGSFLRSGNPANSASQFKKRLTRTQRLGIAVILASSVLQLYQSPWLREIWGKEDIYLSIPELSDDVYLSSIEKISVQRSFFSPAAKAAPSQPACPPTNDFFTSQVINKTLFSLGIILIELCLNRRFEELHPPSDPQSVDTQHSLLYDYKLANCLIEDVYAEGGTEYGYVVQRCLRCEFAGPDSQKRMDIFAFRRMVYQSVLLPLQDDYEKFSVDLGKRH